jgi:predicted choloylglycine hydrolase
MKRLMLALAFLLPLKPAPACLILFLTDGIEVLVANHEDWYARDAEINFVPAKGNKFGMMYFDFASEGTAQGGMNTEGLFFDGTATPKAPYPENNARPDCNCYIWKKILQDCSTVEEAITLIQKYRVPELERVHIMFADKKGSSAIIGIYDGRLQIHRKSKSYQLLTNFNIANPSYGGEPVCSRYMMAEQMLKHDSIATISNLRNILSQTTQGKLTVYSNIYNLTKGEVTIYSEGNFEKEIKINLAEALRKGRHATLLSDLVKQKK